MAPEAAPAAPMVQAPEAKAPDAPEAVPMAVPKVLEVSAAHEIPKELPVADPPQLTYELSNWGLPLPPAPRRCPAVIRQTPQGAEVCTERTRAHPSRLFRLRFSPSPCLISFPFPSHEPKVLAEGG